MKKILVVCIGSLFLITLSGCSLGDIVDRFSDSEDTQIQDINPGSTRVYMDEIRGTLQYFTGNQLTLLSGSDNYVFDISQATLECADGICAALTRRSSRSSAAFSFRAASRAASCAACA